MLTLLVLKLRAKVQQKNDIRKYVCHFFSNLQDFNPRRSRPMRGKIHSRLPQ